MNSVAPWGSLCHCFWSGLYLFPNLFLTYMSFVYILQLPVLCFMGFLCVETFASLRLHVFLCFFFDFSSACFILFRFVCLCFILLYFMIIL